MNVALLISGKLAEHLCEVEVAPLPLPCFILISLSAIQLQKLTHIHLQMCLNHREALLRPVDLRVAGKAEANQAAKLLRLLFAYKPAANALKCGV